MKQFLASTAILAITAGFAAAEVKITGSARMGLIDDFGDGNVQFTSRVRVNFALSGETDTGLSFGASVRADQSGQGNTENDDSVVFVSGAFGKLSMGDVDGAGAAAVGQVDGVGLTGLSDLNEIYFLGTGGSGLLLDAGFFLANPPAPEVNGDTSMLYEYSTGGLSLYFSATQASYTFEEPCCTWSDTQTLGAGAAYTMDAYRFSVAYERWSGDREGVVTTASIDNLALGADATFGAVTVKARYSKGGSEFGGADFQDHKQAALSATYAADALSFTAYASDVTFEVSGVEAYNRQAFGLGATYDLGGGASAVAGVAKRQETIGGTEEDDTAFDMGLSFSF